MATRLKTIEYAIPQLNTLVDNTLTAMSTITAHIPEFSGVVTFRKCIAMVHFQEGATMLTGNYTTRTIAISIGGAGAVTYASAGLYTGSGENTCIFYACDFTANMVSNWTSGNNKTIAASVLLDATATTIAIVNVGMTLYITYEYDDTQPTQIKTVYIPLNAPVTTLAIAKPGTATATIPALDTELPETSKVYRNMFIVAQGNINSTASTTDSSVSMQIDALAAYTSQVLEMGATSDYWIRFVWDITALGMPTNATAGFYIWGSVARFNHAQAFLTVTYEFDATASSGVFVSLMLPVDMDSPMGGTTASDYQRAKRELFIEEPGTITTKQIAFYAFWSQMAAISTLNMRVGTGSMIAYTDASAVLCGANGAMCRNDSAHTLARGRNTLIFDIYRSDTVDFGWSLSGFFIVNYTASKPTQGYGAANRSIKWNMGLNFRTATAILEDIAATAPTITETDYYMTALGTNFQFFSDSTGQLVSVSVLFEDTASESGVQWIGAYIDSIQTDPETGLFNTFSQLKSFFRRWENDPDTSRLDIKTSRRWRLVCTGVSTHKYLDLWMTIHNIRHTISGNITNSNGGTVTIQLLRAATGELVMSTTRSGNGTYSFSWFDDTETMYVTAYETSSYKGMSKKDVAGTGFDISLSAPASSGSPNYAFIS